MLAANMDIELQILEEIQQLEKKGFKIPYFIHVKAHQDKDIPYHSLSRAAQLNVKEDGFQRLDFI